MQMIRGGGGYQVNLKRESQKQSCWGSEPCGPEWVSTAGRGRLRRNRTGSLSHIVLTQHQGTGGSVQIGVTLVVR